MFKYLLLICLALPHVARGAMAATDTSETSTTIPMPLSETVELIIQDLNKAVELLNHPNREAILDNLERINALAGDTLVKLVAISRMDKANGTNHLGTLGVTHEQVANLARAYYQFYRTLKAAQNNAVSTAETDIIG